jgi:hypothetical protein
MLLVALWLCTEAVPGSKLSSLLMLLSLAGVEGILHKYNHILDVVYALIDVILQQTLGHIIASPHFSILYDTSTDISNEDHLLVYVCGLRTSSTTYIYLCSVKVVSLTNNAVTEMIIKLLKIFGLETRKWQSHFV